MAGVGTRIREVREEQNLTQEELARKIGTHMQTVWRYEHGERVPSVHMLGEIATALGVEPGDLFPKAQAPLPFEAGRPKAEEEQQEIYARAEDLMRQHLEQERKHEARAWAAGGIPQVEFQEYDREAGILLRQLLHDDLAEAALRAIREKLIAEDQKTALEETVAAKEERIAEKDERIAELEKQRV